MNRRKHSPKLFEDGGSMPYLELTNTDPVYVVHMYAVDDLGLGMVGVLHPGIPATPDMRQVLAEALRMGADRLMDGDQTMAQHLGDTKGEQR